MIVYWLRHGTRNFTTGDVPLNEEGLREAQHLAQLAGFKDLTRIICSPKKRALMTVEPLAEKLGIPIEPLDALDQMRRGETEADFVNRVKSFLSELEEEPADSQILLCSHSDWLGVASQIIPTDSLDLKYKMFHCAEVLTFKIEEGLWRLQN
jgi:broad specificity phosphatase PhoE